MRKSVVQFDPLSTVEFAAAEHHYTEVHTAMARRMFRHHVPNLTTYAPQRVRAAYDVSGGMDGPLDAWRFIFLHHDEEHYVPPEWREVVTRDHESCFENVRSYVVGTERTMVDKRAGGTSSAKFVFKLHADPGRAERVDAELARLAEMFDDAFGARLFIVNDIAGQRRSQARSRPGQMTGNEVEPSEVLRIVELYFDHDSWGREFLADERVRTLLWRDLSCDDVHGYLVDEWLCIDRRDGLAPQVVPMVVGPSPA